MKMKTMLKTIGLLVVIVFGIIVYFGMGFCAGFIYVPNYDDNTVSVIDPATNSVVATLAVGKRPSGVAINPAGTAVYVTNSGGGTVSVISTATNTVVNTITVGDSPAGVFITPDGNRVYVANFAAGTVSVINALTSEVDATITVGQFPLSVTVNRSGDRAYVSNVSKDTLLVIDTAKNTVIATISNVPSAISGGGVCINPEGTKIYVLDEVGNIRVIDTFTNKVSNTITGTTTGTPHAVAVSPDQKLLYVASDNSVVQYNLVTKTISKPIAVPAGAYGVSVSSDGKQLYVTSTTGNKVFIIDTDTGNIIATVSVGQGPPPVGQITNLWTNWKGPVSFTLKTTLPLEDSSGNTNFKTSNNSFSGFFQLNTIGRFPGPASIMSTDGSVLANFDKVATIQTNNDKKKTDKILFTGTGTNPFYPLASAFKFNATGTWNKDSSGNATSLKLQGDLGIGYDFGADESSKFSTTLTPDVL
jgi:YVTN family beta-propeller protein